MFFSVFWVVTARFLLSGSEELWLVAGAPVIKQLSKQRGKDGQHEVLICEAEGSPKPSVSWSINGTSVCACDTHTHTNRQYTQQKKCKRNCHHSSLSNTVSHNQSFARFQLWMKLHQFAKSLF